MVLVTLSDSLTNSHTHSAHSHNPPSIFPSLLSSPLPLSLIPNLPPYIERELFKSITPHRITKQKQNIGHYCVNTGVRHNHQPRPPLVVLEE